MRRHLVTGSAFVGWILFFIIVASLGGCNAFRPEDSRPSCTINNQCPNVVLGSPDSKNTTDAWSDRTDTGQSNQADQDAEGSADVDVTPTPAAPEGG